MGQRRRTWLAHAACSLSLLPKCTKPIRIVSIACTLAPPCRGLLTLIDQLIRQMNWACLMFGVVVIIAGLWYAFRARYEYDGPVEYMRKDM